jgi:uroporphyrinogen-III synthase
MRVLITRPQEDAAPLAAELAARGHEAVVAPLLTVEPRRDAEIDLAGVQALAFTSANGARVFAALSDARDLPVFAVGQSTAEAARAAGFARVESAAGDVAALTTLIAERLGPAAGAVFHGAASHLAGDLGGRLEEKGFTVRRAVLYEAVAAEALAPDLREDLAAGRIDAVLIFSPRTAETFVRLVSDADVASACRSCDAVCLSPAVADKLGPLAWRGVHVAAKPTREALLESLAAVQATTH